ncbi:MAG: type II toxin-antitoxin system VapB family antitoxin [Methylococcales bacterium]|nr:type II toxin-antitoxin system VapB family antitoxin [Methylococcales bacterium]
MRTNIIIDDLLMANILKVTGVKTKREAVEMGLKTLLMLKQQEAIKAFKGKLTWQDDFDKMKFDYYSGRIQRLDRLF